MFCFKNLFYVGFVLFLCVQSFLSIFTGRMFSNDFQNYLSVSILPFVRSKMPYGHKFFMDNHPKHTSQSTKQFMLLNNINHFETPPQSPDLMPIEMVCLIKDNFICNIFPNHALYFRYGMI